METTRNLNCLRCGEALQSMGRQTFQLGQESFLFGSLGNLLAGAIDIDLYVCPKCGKLEFFTDERP